MEGNWPRDHSLTTKYVFLGMVIRTGYKKCTLSVFTP
jgi:hypothetical protein